MDDSPAQLIRTPQEELDHNFKEAYIFWRKVADSGARLSEVEMAWNVYVAAREMRLFGNRVQKPFHLMKSEF